MPHGSRTNCANFCEFPASAPIPSRRDDMHQAADWVADQFRRMRFTAEVIPTSGHPLVYAESPAVPGAPTALVYGHYDVQPADPLEKWTSPPFEPTRRDGNLYARGATDDKGQVLTHMKSAEAWITVEGRLPVNLKFLIEGEEEVGSAGRRKAIWPSTPTAWRAIASSSATAASSPPACRPSPTACGASPITSCA